MKSLLEHFALYARNPIRLKDFYVDVMGMRVVRDDGGNPPSYFLADENAMALEIIARPPEEANVNQRWICHIAFWVDDFEAAAAELQDKGIEFEAETAVANDAMKTRFFQDPEGNRLQLVWRSRRLGDSTAELKRSHPSRLPSESRPSTRS